MRELTAQENMALDALAEDMDRFIETHFADMKRDSSGIKSIATPEWSVPVEFADVAKKILTDYVSYLARRVANGDALECAQVEPDGYHGFYHVASNWLNARLRDRGVPAGDWSWFGLMSLLGVSRERIDADQEAAWKTGRRQLFSNIC